MTGRVLWIRVCPSFRPDVFLGLAHQFFLKLSMVFWEKILLPQKWGKWANLNLLENLFINFFWISLLRKFKLIPVSLHKSRIWEKSTSWDMGQNALGQSDCRIFKSTVSLEQNDEKASFLVYWYRFMEIKSWSKNVGVDMVKNGCGPRTLKLSLPQEGINRINWSLVCW